MRISFIIDQMRTGGAERVIANLSNQFVSQGHNVSVIMLNENAEQSYYPVDSRVHLIPVKREYRKNNPIKKILLLRHCIRSARPEIIISFLHHINVYAYFASLGLRIPHIVSERNDPRLSPKRVLIRLLRNFVFNSVDGCVFQTGGAKSFFSARLQEKSEIIPNPVVLMYEPTDHFEREKKITAAGRLVPQKNYGMMLRAFYAFSEKYPDFKLVICGEGSARSSVEDLIRELELESRVKLLGQVANPHEIMHNSVAFALSSDYEGMPNALLEAMALGVPSVSSDCPCGGPSDLIKNRENGILVPVGDADAMAAAFESLATDAELSERLSTNAKSLRTIYSVETIAEHWLEYIATVKNSRK